MQRLCFDSTVKLLIKFALASLGKALMNRFAPNRLRRPACGWLSLRVQARSDTPAAARTSAPPRTRFARLISLVLANARVIVEARARFASPSALVVEACHRVKGCWTRVEIGTPRVRRRGELPPSRLRAGRINMTPRQNFYMEIHRTPSDESILRIFDV